MNDSAIINIISSIYSKIVIFFLSIFIIFIILFFALLHGIHIHELRLPYVKIKELYIKWDEKLIISIEDAQILSDTSHKREKPFEIQTTLAYVTDMYNYFKRINIKHLHYKDIRASINYAENSSGFVKIESKFFLLNGSIFIDDNNVYLHIAKLQYHPLDVEARGYVLFDKSNKSLKTNLDIAMLNEAYFKLFATLKSDILHFKTEFKNEIKHPKVILEALSLPKGVHYWAVDAYTTTGVKVEAFQGDIDIKNPKKSLTTIYAAGEAENIVYTYNKNIEPIHTTSTKLEFKNGILYIRPQNPTTYGFDLQKSYLTIDFAKKEELLTLYLKFDRGRLDKNILHILKTYDIDVPMTQLDGYTQTDLTLKVYLRHLRVKAAGTFLVQKGTFHYLDNDIDVEKLVLHLKDSHIWAKNMQASLAKRIQSRVDLDLYLSKHSQGKIDFYLQQVDLNEQDLHLESKAHIVYYINKVGQDTIEVPKTYWRLSKIPITIEGGKFAYSFKNQTLILPVIKINVAKNDILLLSGNVSFGNKSADLDLDLIKMHYKNFELAQSDLYIHLIYTNEALHLSTNKQARIYIDNKEATLDKFDATFQNGHLKADNLVLTMQNLFQSSFNVDYDLQKKRGKLTFTYLNFYLKNSLSIFESEKPLVFKLYTHKAIRLSSKKLAAALSISKSGDASLELFSLKKLLPYSQLLQTYKIQEGTLKLTTTKKGLKLDADITSEYALLVQDDIIINRYKVQGYLDTKKLLTLNKNIVISIDDKIDIQAKHIGLNISQIEKLIDTISNREEKQKNHIRLYTHIDDGYLYLSKARRILFDSLDLQTIGDETTAQLKHKKGSAGFRYKAKQFYLYGSGFGDEFMGHLFFLSKFKGGVLDFSVIGSFNDYRGIFEITDTTILDYKILNNILAFIDTVPSLVTFSLPSYSTEGLKVSKAYASFHYKDDIFNFDNIRLDSKQIQIVGIGKANFKKDFVDLVLQLKTNLANKASKIPVVGYILFDGKSISTTLKVSGKLENPEVTTMLAKDIVVAPLNIIKRTLLLPAHLLGLDKENKSSK